jgi:hypothetical protein
MTLRTLRDMTYSGGIPMSGRCTVCGQLFRTPAEALADSQKARWDFYKAFDLHKCATRPE